MGEVVDISTLMSQIKDINDSEDKTLIEFLEAIKEYSKILLSKKSTIEKLQESMPLFQRINPLFLNTYRLEKEPNELEIKVLKTLYNLQIVTDRYLGILDPDAEEDLEGKVKHYESEISRLSADYLEASKQVFRAKTVSDFKDRGNN